MLTNRRSTPIDREDEKLEVDYPEPELVLHPVDPIPPQEGEQVDPEPAFVRQDAEGPLCRTRRSNTTTIPKHAAADDRASRRERLPSSTWPTREEDEIQSPRVRRDWKQFFISQFRELATLEN